MDQRTKRLREPRAARSETSYPSICLLFVLFLDNPQNSPTERTLIVCCVFLLSSFLSPICGSTSACDFLFVSIRNRFELIYLPLND